MDIQLNEGDLARLYKQYSHYRAKWMFIGDALGISTGDLEAIGKDQRVGDARLPGSCDECFREVLIRWLRQPGEKNERKLCQAAEKPKFSGTAIADWTWIIGAVVLIIICFNVGGKQDQADRAHTLI